MHVFEICANSVSCGHMGITLLTISNVKLVVTPKLWSCCTYCTHSATARKRQTYSCETTYNRQRGRKNSRYEVYKYKMNSHKNQIAQKRHTHTYCENYRIVEKTLNSCAIMEIMLHTFAKQQQQ